MRWDRRRLIVGISSSGHPVRRWRGCRPCRALRKPAALRCRSGRQQPAVSSGGGRPPAIPAARAAGIRHDTQPRLAEQHELPERGAGRQPFEATLDTRQFLLAGFHDSPGRASCDPGGRDTPALAVRPPRTGSPFAFAGLWGGGWTAPVGPAPAESLFGPEPGGPVETFAILTTAANATVCGRSRPHAGHPASGRLESLACRRGHPARAPSRG